MKVRTFYTDGKQGIFEGEYDKPELEPTEIEVKSVYTGICRSDIDMYAGTFQLLPRNIQGHECVGIVTKVGNEVTQIKEGDYVATRGEPGFADYYNSKAGTWVKIPKLEPAYILEPVACAINIASSLGLRYHTYTPEPVLLLGSGFLATIVHTYLSRTSDDYMVVVGNANPEYWRSKKNVMMKTIDEIRDEKFKYVIDLSDKPEYLDLNIYAEGAKIVLAAEKHPKANISFGQFLWNAVEIKFPSPRNPSFFGSMYMAETMITDGEINVDTLWTKSYDRDTEVKLGFEEGLARPPGYSRGYISWQK